MATETKGGGSGQDRHQPKGEMTFTVTHVRRTDGCWLHNIKVRMFVDLRLVAICDAKLIIEATYTSRTQHFFSAMMDQSNTMGDLAQLLLWSENRWIFDGPWQGMKEYGDRMPVRKELDEELRQSKLRRRPKIRGYFTPVLTKPRKRS